MTHIGAGYTDVPRPVSVVVEDLFAASREKRGWRAPQSFVSSFAAPYVVGQIVGLP